MWYLSFFWLAFNKKASINFQRAEEACDILAKIALSALKLGRPKIAEACIDNISSITDSYDSYINTQDKKINSYNLVDLLMPLLYIRMLAVKKNINDLIERIDKKLSPYESHKDSQQISEAFVTRKKQLQDELKREMHYSEGSSAIGILQALLNE